MQKMYSLVNDLHIGIHVFLLVQRFNIFYTTYKHKIKTISPTKFIKYSLHSNIVCTSMELVFNKLQIMAGSSCSTAEMNV